MSARRRGNGEGSIYRRADGLWAGAVSYPDVAGGKRKRHTVYGRTRTEVRRKLGEARSRLDVGAPVRDARETVGAFAQRWISATLAASGASRPRRRTTRPSPAPTSCRARSARCPLSSRPTSRS